MTDHRDDRELERMMREGLEVRARETDVDVPIADRARSAARSGRRRTATAAGLAAASVVAVAGGVALLGEDGRQSGGRDVAGDGDRTPTVVDEWRTEYWHDIAVDVPADWGWGGSPRADSIGRGNELVACAAGAFRAPGVEGEPEWATTPYVGRPFTLTDVCEVFRDGQWREPEAPYLWLGSPIEPGTREFDNGFVQETIEFEGEPVTVATDDPSLRQQILESVRGGETCLSELEATPLATTSFDPADGVRGLTVCVYHHDTQAEPLRLAYALELGPDAAEELAATLAAAPPAELDCNPNDGYSLVQLEMQSSDDPGLVNTYLVRTASCFGIEIGRSMTPLTQAMAETWAVAGVPTVVYASGPRWIYGYFIGPQG